MILNHQATSNTIYTFKDTRAPELIHIYNKEKLQAITVWSVKRGAQSEVE